jgi:hypothetical protein
MIPKHIFQPLFQSEGVISPPPGLIQVTRRALHHARRSKAAAAQDRIVVPELD